MWAEVDDSKVFKILDLEDVEKTFSAYQRQQVTKKRAICPSLSFRAKCESSCIYSCMSAILMLELFVAVLANKILEYGVIILVCLQWIVIFMMSSGKTERFLMKNMLW